MFNIVRTVKPATLPVSLDEMKLHLGFEDDGKDLYIKALLQSAVDDLDGYEGALGRALVDQTWRCSVRQWCERIRFPLSPLRSVLAIKYYDQANEQRTLDRANYTVNAVADSQAQGGFRYEPLADALGPYVRWTQAAVIPGLYPRDDAIEVTFVAGYGAPAAVPENIKTAIKFHVERHFGSLTPEEMAAFEQAENRLLGKLRRIGL